MKTKFPPEIPLPEGNAETPSDHSPSSVAPPLVAATDETRFICMRSHAIGAASVQVAMQLAESYAKTGVPIVPRLNPSSERFVFCTLTSWSNVILI